MKIHILTDLDVLFGRLVRVAMKALLEAGHEVEFIDLGPDTDLPLPDTGPCDVNLLVAGMYAFERMARHGVPRHGRLVAWLFDPLTDDRTSVHQAKAAWFETLVPHLSGVACMDRRMAAWLGARYAALPTRHVPCLVAPESLVPPLPDGERDIDILWLGSDNPRRRSAEALFAAADVPARFHWEHVWGHARDQLRRRSRIVLALHADAAHTYFDQFRAVEAWAAGAVFVAEASDDLAEQDATDGVHFASAPLARMPQLCRDLLADLPRRESMVQASQALLRQRFAPHVGLPALLELLHGAAPGSQ